MKAAQMEECVGTDFAGNKYIIRTGDPMTRRAEVRYVKGPDGEMLPYGEKVPVEWEGWLRYTRNNPPTIEELEKNILQRQKIQERVLQIQEREETERAELAGETIETTTDSTVPVVQTEDVEPIPEKVPFPKHRDLERTPGEFLKHKFPDA